MPDRPIPHRDAQDPDAALVVVAAGTGSRLGASVHKAFVTLGGQPLVEFTLRRLLGVAWLEPVVLVGHPDDRPALEDLAARLPRPVTLVDGGARRQDSVAAGVAATGDARVVLVHDAARPFPPRERLAELARAAHRTGCALLATPVADTLKEVGEPTAAGPTPAGPTPAPGPATAAGGEDRPAPDASRLVARTVPREGLWAAQTPQAFVTAALRELLAAADAEGRTVTDEASLFEHAGRGVRIVEGSRINFKITTAEDLALARAVLTAEGGRAEP